MSEHVCPTCGGDRRPEPLRKGKYEYALCGTCASGWLDPVPLHSERLYGEGYFTRGENGGYADYLGDELLHLDNARRRLAMISAFARPEGWLLDVGCGPGFFLSVARSAGWNVDGVDPSPWVATVAQQRFGLRVHPGMGSVAGSRRAFNVITAFQVLEHTPDPLGTLRTMRSMASEKAILAIETWDRTSAVARLFGRQWQQISPPSVIHLFSREGLRRLLPRAGFEIIAIRSTSKRVSAGFVAGLLARKYPRAASPLQRITRTPVARWSMVYSFGDLITILARAGPTPR